MHLVDGHQEPDLYTRDHSMLQIQSRPYKPAHIVKRFARQPKEGSTAKVSLGKRPIPPDTDEQ
jgi:hypothetical protein